MLRSFYAQAHFPENQFDEREKSFRQISKNTVSLAQIDLGYCDFAGKGIEPLPVGLDANKLHARPSVTFPLAGLASGYVSQRRPP
jgi:hypothetical protein